MSTAEVQATFLGDFAEFLTARPETDEILCWRPSEAAQLRLSDLLYRQNSGLLENDEVQELNSAIQAELMLRLLKAKLQLARAKSE
jgi:hypothetical protein